MEGWELTNYTWFVSLGHVAKDKSFYASLHTQPASQNQEIRHTEMEIKTGTLNNTLISDWR